MSMIPTPIGPGSLTIDLVRDSGITKQYDTQGRLTYAQIDRSFQVTGLTATGVAPNLAQSIVENYVKTVVPIGTPHPNDAYCTARYYVVKSLDSDDAAGGVISYVFTQFGGTNTEWTIQSTSDTEVEETNAQYDPAYPNDPSHLIPITIANYIPTWQNPTDPPPFSIPAGGANPIPDQPLPATYPNAQVGRKQKLVVYSKTITDPMAAQTFDTQSSNFVGAVNTAIFTGITQGSAAQNYGWAPGTVMCMNAGLIVKPYDGTRVCSVEVLWKPQGHQPYVSYVSPISGQVPGNVWRAGTENGTTFKANGVVRTTCIGAADLNQLLTLI